MWSAASPPLCAAPAAAKAARTGLGDPSTSYFARRSINASYALFSHPWRKHTSDDHFSAPTQIWPMHRAFCGERAFPVHFPVFRQEDVDRVIAILSDEPVLERLAAAHLKFKEDLQLFYSGMGTSVEEIKVRLPSCLGFRRSILGFRAQLSSVHDQDNLNSFANRYDLLVTLPSRHDEPTSQDTHLAMRYFQTLVFLHTYTRATGEPFDATNLALSRSLPYLAGKRLPPDDLWSAQITHRLLIWSTVLTHGGQTGDRSLFLPALLALQKFLTDSLNGPHAALAAELSSVFRNMFAG